MATLAKRWSDNILVAKGRGHIDLIKQVLAVTHEVIHQLQQISHMSKSFKWRSDDILHQKVVHGCKLKRQWLANANNPDVVILVTLIFHFH